MASAAAASSTAAVLITGGNGYLAQHLIHRLLPQAKAGVGAQGLSPVRLGYTYSGSNNGGLPPLHAALPEEHASGLLWAGRADLTDAPSLDAAIKAFHPTVLVHAAAFSSPAGCEKDPNKALAVNCPAALLDALDAHAPDCLLVFLSTDQVFSGQQPEGVLYTEADEPVPANVYGRSKLAFERLLQERRSHASVILRSSNIIGGPAPFMGQSKFLQWLDEKLKTAMAPLELFDDETRSFVYVGDILDAIQGLIASSQREALACLEGEEESKEGSTHKPLFPVLYHMGGPEPLSRVGLAEKVCAVRGYSLDIQGPEGGRTSRIAPVARASMDLGFTSPLNIAMDSTKLSKLSGLNFRCTPMEAALQAIFLS